MPSSLITMLPAAALDAPMPLACPPSARQSTLMAPPVISVLPVYVLLQPLSTCVPPPTCVRPPVPLISPEKVPLTPPVVSLDAPRLTFPPPRPPLLSTPTLMSNPPRSSVAPVFTAIGRSEEHTSELQSLMRIPYA